MRSIVHARHRVHQEDAAARHAHALRAVEVLQLVDFVHAGVAAVDAMDVINVPAFQLESQPCGQEGEGPHFV